MREYFDLTQVISAHIHKWGEAGFFLLYLIILIYVIFRKKGMDRHMKNVAISMLIIIFVMYLPPLVNFFAIHYFKGHEYSRIGWGLLPVSVIAFFLTLSVFRTEDISRRDEMMRFGVALVLILLLGAKSTSYFEIPDNIYKLPQDTIDIAEMVEENCKGHKEPVNIGVTYYANTKPENVYDNVVWGLRAYDTDNDYYSISTLDSESDPNYPYDILVTKPDFQDASGLIDKEYMEVGQTDHLIVYKYVGP